MKTSKSGRGLIIEHEGFKKFFYLCPAGYKTIGVGHRLTEKELKNKYIEFTMPEWSNAHNKDWWTGLSDIEVECLLSQDLRRFERFVNVSYASFIPRMSQDCFDGLVSFVFNIGIGAAKKSDSYDLIQHKLLTDAADIIFQWHKITVDGNKVPSKGLLKRRKAEIKLILGDRYDAAHWDDKERAVLDQM